MNQRDIKEGFGSLLLSQEHSCKNPTLTNELEIVVTPYSSSSIVA